MCHTKNALVYFRSSEQSEQNPKNYYFISCIIWTVRERNTMKFSTEQFQVLKLISQLFRIPDSPSSIWISFTRSSRRHVEGEGPTQPGSAESLMPPPRPAAPSSPFPLRTSAFFSHRPCFRTVRITPYLLISTEAQNRIQLQHFSISL